MVAAFEWLRGARDDGLSSPEETDTDELRRRLLATYRPPRVGVDYALRVSTVGALCGQCGGEVLPGLMGWYCGNDSGALCSECLEENQPTLSLGLRAMLLGLPQVLRGAVEEEDTGAECDDASPCGVACQPLGPGPGVA